MEKIQREKRKERDRDRERGREGGRGTEGMNVCVREKRKEQQNIKVYTVYHDAITISFPYSFVFVILQPF